MTPPPAFLGLREGKVWTVNSFLSKSMWWFLCDRNFRRERVKVKAEAYLEPSRASMMEIYCENSNQISAIFTSALS